MNKRVLFVLSAVLLVGCTDDTILIGDAFSNCPDDTYCYDTTNNKEPIAFTDTTLMWSNVTYWQQTQYVEEQG